MKMHDLKIPGYLVLALVALMVASSASAYVLLSPARTWDSAPTYIVDNGGLSSVNDSDGGVSATVQAITSNQAWNGAGSGNVVGATSGNTNNLTLGDGTPMLVFDDPINVCNGNCLAATFTGYYSQRNDGTYRIDDADIVTNTSYSWTSQNEDPNGSGCSSEFYIEGVMVHEIGHGLGLGHTNVNGATMYPSVSSCNNGPASIENDDADGIDALYGGGGPGGGSCTLGQKGDSCSVDGDCCSNKCRGPSGRKTCK
ncbi:MAG: matrixin family metalloprotease [Acidobacteriota bacterium]|nr:matrixin family metalloprotease [Acidobacteriota bacterium]